ncbi:hypothetical protein M8818_004455 [Zalaria obscura]|uniref:Uncharacterized protein n=1 Tax=Zalaria obscura TaxID=2024903 RepID=A0ACC3SEA6_9PEZI
MHRTQGIRSTSANDVAARRKIADAPLKLRLGLLRLTSSRGSRRRKGACKPIGLAQACRRELAVVHGPSQPSASYKRIQRDPLERTTRAATRRSFAAGERRPTNANWPLYEIDADP